MRIAAPLPPAADEHPQELLDPIDVATNQAGGEPTKAQQVLCASHYINASRVLFTSAFRAALPRPCIEFQSHAPTALASAS